jgi:glycosyltransferase involved in cell wall biosynthesis
VTVPWGANLGGAEMMLWTFLKTVDRSRLQPTVVFFEPGPLERDVAALGIRTAVVPTGRLRQPLAALRAIRALVRLLRAERPDVILNWVAKAQLYGGAAAMVARTSDRVVWWQHGVPTGHWMDRLATAIPARAVGCSSEVAARAQRSLRPRRRVFTVHPGLAARSAAPPKALGIPDGRVVLGIVGRLQPWKGQHHFIRAIRELVARGLDVHGVIVGGTAHGFSADYEPALRRLISDLSLGDRILMTGQVADPDPYLAAIDVLVSASTNEPFGIVLLEGMQRGLPVVAVGDAGPAEIVEHGRTGVLIDAPHPLALADAIGPLVRDPALRRRMGEAGRRRLEQHFTAAAMTDAIHAALRDCVVRQRAAA